MVEKSGAGQKGEVKYSVSPDSTGVDSNEGISAYLVALSTA
jgi:hypothetical protein